MDRQITTKQLLKAILRRVEAAVNREGEEVLTWILEWQEAGGRHYRIVPNRVRNPDQYFPK